MSQNSGVQKQTTVVRRIWYTSAALIGNIMLLGMVGLYVEEKFDSYTDLLAER